MTVADTVVLLLLGGVLGIAVALLVLATVVVVLDSFYRGRAGVSGDVAWIEASSLRGSDIAGFLRLNLVPGLRGVLGLLLPADLRRAG